MKSKEWLNRQKNDPFVIKAQNKGYLSRASFKLLEIEKKFHFIKKSNNIIEFGSSPGGWCQVILECNINAKITAIDLSEMKIKHGNIQFIKKDFKTIDYKSLNKKYDLILSDIAPNTTGHKSTDHLRISTYIHDIIDLLNLIAYKNTNFVIKIWKGTEEKLIIEKLKSQFQKVTYFKPNASRKDSSEIFIVAQDFII